MFTNSRDIIRRLKQDGFELLRVGGSHHQFRHPFSKRRVPQSFIRKKTCLSRQFDQSMNKRVGRVIEICLGYERLYRLDPQRP